MPPYKAHPLRLCAVYGCKNPRFMDMKRSLVRRWCVFHVRHYEQEVTNSGGALVVAFSLRGAK